VSAPHCGSLREHYPASEDLEPFETELWREDLVVLDEGEDEE
jgi:hypothetical protein